jgi:hypothetical protein
MLLGIFSEALNERRRCDGLAEGERLFRRAAYIVTGLGEENSLRVCVECAVANVDKESRRWFYLCASSHRLFHHFPTLSQVVCNGWCGGNLTDGHFDQVIMHDGCVAEFTNSRVRYEGVEGGCRWKSDGLRHDTARARRTSTDDFKKKNSSSSPLSSIHFTTSISISSPITLHLLIVSVSFRISSSIMVRHMRVMD